MGTAKMDIFVKKITQLHGEIPNLKEKLAGLYFITDDSDWFILMIILATNLPEQL